MAPPFRAANASDIGDLLVLRRAFCDHERIPIDEVRSGRALSELMAEPSLGRIWLIDSGGSLAGYVVLTFSYSLEFDGRDAFIDELYVKDDFRGRGLGQQAIRLVEATCRGLGIQALHLEVDRHNHRARTVYEQSGFEDRGNYLLTKRL